MLPGSLLERHWIAIIALPVNTSRLAGYSHELIWT